MRASQHRFSLPYTYRYENSMATNEPLFVFVVLKKHGNEAGLSIRR